jgi:hypothetical protein
MISYDQWKTAGPDDDAPEVDNPLNYRNLGMRAVSPMHSVGLDCHHCRVTWGGCAAECCCPVCGSPKDYTREGQCMCERCAATNHGGHGKRENFKQRGRFHERHDA